jgi:cobalt-precorrin 5A hydrolase / precorrin-3B C17-methyltransferase
MVVKPVVLALTRSSETTAARVAAAINAQVHGRTGRVKTADVFFNNALDHARDLFASGTPIVGVCASGILIRAVAPLLADKRSEPPVISISDDGTVVVPLLGGHHGANRLARMIADALGGSAAVTTAGDVALGVALDEPPAGWRLVNPDDAKDAMALLLGGGGVLLLGDNAKEATWLHELPVGDDVRISCTMSAVGNIGPNHLHFAPQRVALGVGCTRNCPSDEVSALVSSVLSDAGVSPAAIHSVNTIDLKADEPAILELARSIDAPLRLFSAHELESETPRLENPSKVVLEEVGCHGVSEGAALAQVGTAGSLWKAKRKSANATCALTLSDLPLTVQNGRSRGRLSVVGIGPGQASWRTPEVSRLVADADELVGYGLYIDLLGSLVAGKPRADFPLGREEERCRYALECAAKGRNVALVCSGDAGIYAMASLVFELMDRSQSDRGVSPAARRVEVICSPGVSALQGAAARAGAPLGHDFCTISLSDLLTPREDILRRIAAAGQGDFVIAFYNPVSVRRRTLLAEARDMLLQHRPADTPVMLASNLGRPTEYVRYRRLADLRVNEVDMLTVVLVGSSQSRLVHLGEGPRMYTPRGYAKKMDQGPDSSHTPDEPGQDAPLSGNDYLAASQATS